MKTTHPLICALLLGLVGCAAQPVDIYLAADQETVTKSMVNPDQYWVLNHDENLVTTAVLAEGGTELSRHSITPRDLDLDGIVGDGLTLTTETGEIDVPLAALLEYEPEELAAMAPDALPVELQEFAARVETLSDDQLVLFLDAMASRIGEMDLSLMSDLEIVPFSEIGNKAGGSVCEPNVREAVLSCGTALATALLCLTPQGRLISAGSKAVRALGIAIQAILSIGGEGTLLAADKLKFASCIGMIAMGFKCAHNVSDWMDAADLQDSLICGDQRETVPAWVRDRAPELYPEN